MHKISSNGNVEQDKTCLNTVFKAKYENNQNEMLKIKTITNEMVSALHALSFSLLSPSSICYHISLLSSVLFSFLQGQNTCKISSYM